MSTVYKMGCGNSDASRDTVDANGHVSARHTYSERHIAALSPDKRPLELFYARHTRPARAGNQRHILTKNKSVPATHLRASYADTPRTVELDALQLEPLGQSAALELRLVIVLTPGLIGFCEIGTSNEAFGVFQIDLARFFKESL